MSATTRAIHAAKQSLNDLIDAVRPLWDDPEQRAIIVQHYEAAHAHLHDALTAATRPLPLGHASEDGTGLGHG